MEYTTNHTFRLAKLSEAQVIETTTKNFEHLRQILAWNVQQNIRLFRIGSSIIPFASHATFTLNWPDVFADQISQIREFVQQNGLRLSMHPGQYTVLNTPNAQTLENSVRELEWHARLIHELDPEQGVIVLHVGGMYGNREAALERFDANFSQYLSPIARQRLGIENDDTIFAAGEVLDLCRKLGTPMIFDFFHHQCLPTGQDYREDITDLLEGVVATWHGKVPKLHLSSQKPDGLKAQHSDYILQQDFDELVYWMEQVYPGREFDLMIEAKMKEKAVQALSCGLFPPVQVPQAGGK
jgi:UV DNA damage endonuclease